MNLTKKRAHESCERLIILVCTYGICRILRSLAVIANDFGEGKFTPADPKWLEISAYISQCADHVERILES